MTDKLTPEEELELIYQVMAGSNWTGIEDEINQSKIARRLRDHLDIKTLKDGDEIIDIKRGRRGFVRDCWVAAGDHKIDGEWKNSRQHFIQWADGYVGHAWDEEIVKVIP